MRYYHRTSLSPADALAKAEAFFAARAQPAEASGPRRGYRYAGGTVTIEAVPEHGHYTLVTVTTDQMGESEVDKLAKRYLAELHAGVHPQHEVRGAY